MSIYSSRRRRRRAAEKMLREALENGQDNNDNSGEAGGNGRLDADGAGDFGYFAGDGAGEPISIRNTGADGNAGDGATGADRADGGTGGGDGTGTTAGDGTGASTTTGAITGAGGNAPGNPAGEGDKPDSARLTAEQYNEIMRNKGNVMKELKRLGVKYSDRDEADELRELLNGVLNDMELMPE